jgi:hypothetical protein
MPAARRSSFQKNTKPTDHNIIADHKPQATSHKQATMMLSCLGTPGTPMSMNMSMSMGMNHDTDADTISVSVSVSVSTPMSTRKRPQPAAAAEARVLQSTSNKKMAMSKSTSTSLIRGKRSTPLSTPTQGSVAGTVTVTAREINQRMKTLFGGEYPFLCEQVSAM